jgi:hypothetical protein
MSLRHLRLPALDSLSPEDLDTLYLEVATLEADLRARLLTRRPTPPQSDKILCLSEAAARLGMSQAWLKRKANWLRVGGYLDADRRVKFPVSALEAWVRARGQG